MMPLSQIADDELRHSYANYHRTEALGRRQGTYVVVPCEVCDGLPWDGEIECIECDGVGWVLRVVLPCDGCGGNGEVDVQKPPRRMDQIAPQYETRTCTDCEGGGHELSGVFGTLPAAILEIIS